MHLRQLRYFVAIARQRHFARAAEECGVSQPTLSAGLSALEADLGHRLVERDRRFAGLTSHGEAILPWAEQILGAVGSMASTLSASAAPLGGEFSLMAIPAAQSLTGRFGEALLRRNPGLSLSVRSATSREIDRALHAFECDAGLTYLDHEPPANTLSIALDAERYLFVTRADGIDAAVTEASWQMIASTPLCLLHQSMQFRRILDARMAALGTSIVPRAVADSYVVLLDMVRSGRFSTIIPHSYGELLQGLDWARFLPIADEGDARRIGLVVMNRSPLSAVVQAGLSAARDLVLEQV
ncbi:LysR family transcriptional regulator [Blastomonas fulva]|uniref:LysR family transcriptional regulator n=1 Tax=Blastomonas fulva TaxID=1550728 RepID=UPI0025A47665|nr:LysR family transcriptional regulator [Blastomonas fulva]MDM7928179.1 LysR family transcriptional regulator [Blastomonas fulva]MDM7965105.1 LysR family transcriptional regulator [Blastomonas fulva]